MVVEQVDGGVVVVGQVEFRVVGLQSAVFVELGFLFLRALLDGEFRLAAFLLLLLGGGKGLQMLLLQRLVVDLQRHGGFSGGLLFLSGHGEVDDGGVPVGQRRHCAVIAVVVALFSFLRLFTLVMAQPVNEVLGMHHLADELDGFVGEIDEVGDECGDKDEPGAHRADVFLQDKNFLMADVAPDVDGAVHVVEQVAEDEVAEGRHQQQEGGAVDEPLPQAHLVDAHDAQRSGHEEEGDEEAGDAEAALYEEFGREHAGGAHPVVGADAGRPALIHASGEDVGDDGEQCEDRHDEEHAAQAETQLVVALECLFGRYLCAG